jgi:hypothetical protein
MKVLKDKFSKTKTEKLKEILKEILEFDYDEKDTSEKYWDKFSKLLNQVNKEKIQEHLNYLMCTMMVEKAAIKKKLSPNEQLHLKEIIEVNSINGEREPKKDDEVEDNLKFEFRKLKIENQRDSESKIKGKIKNAHFNKKYVNQKKEQKGSGHKKDSLWEQVAKVNKQNKDLTEDITLLKKNLEEVMKGVKELLNNTNNENNNDKKGKEKIKKNLKLKQKILIKL